MGTMGIIGVCIFAGLIILIGIIFYNTVIKNKMESPYVTPDWDEPVAIENIKVGGRASFNFFFDGLFEDEEQTIEYTVNEKDDHMLHLNGKEFFSGDRMTPKDNYIRVMTDKFNVAGQYVLKFDIINANNRHVRPSFLISVS